MSEARKVAVLIPIVRQQADEIAAELITPESRAAFSEAVQGIVFGRTFEERARCAEIACEFLAFAGPAARDIREAGSSEARP